MLRVRSVHSELENRFAFLWLDEVGACELSAGAIGHRRGVGGADGLGELRLVLRERVERHEAEGLERAVVVDKLDREERRGARGAVLEVGARVDVLLVVVVVV